MTEGRLKEIEKTIDTATAEELISLVRELQLDEDYEAYEPDDLRDTLHREVDGLWECMGWADGGIRTKEEILRNLENMKEAFGDEDFMKEYCPKVNTEKAGKALADFTEKVKFMYFPDLLDSEWLYSLSLEKKEFALYLSRWIKEDDAVTGLHNIYKLIEMKVDIAPGKNDSIATASFNGDPMFIPSAE